MAQIPNAMFDADPVRIIDPVTRGARESIGQGIGALLETRSQDLRAGAADASIAEDRRQFDIANERRIEEQEEQTLRDRMDREMIMEQERTRREIAARAAELKFAEVETEEEITRVSFEMEREAAQKALDYQMMMMAQEEGFDNLANLMAGLEEQGETYIALMDRQETNTAQTVVGAIANISASAGFAEARGGFPGDIARSVRAVGRGAVRAVAGRRATLTPSDVPPQFWPVAFEGGTGVGSDFSGVNWTELSPLTHQLVGSLEATGMFSDLPPEEQAEAKAALATMVQGSLNLAFEGQAEQTGDTFAFRSPTYQHWRSSNPQEEIRKAAESLGGYIGSQSVRGLMTGLTESFKTINVGNDRASDVYRRGAAILRANTPIATARDEMETMFGSVSKVMTAAATGQMGEEARISLRRSVETVANPELRRTLEQLLVEGEAVNALYRDVRRLRVEGLEGDVARGGRLADIEQERIEATRELRQRLLDTLRQNSARFTQE